MLENNCLVVKQSKILKNQLGVITKRNYKRGELLFIVKGPILKRRTKYSFSVDLDRHIDPRLVNGKKDFGHYTNHSCNPNAFASIIDKDCKTPYIEIISRREIKKGEEVTIDYASFEYETVVDGLQCNCGQKRCRGKIFGFKDLPYDVKIKYRKDGIVPSYLMKL